MSRSAWLVGGLLGLLGIAGWTAVTVATSRVPAAPALALVMALSVATCAAVASRRREGLQAGLLGGLVTAAGVPIAVQTLSNVAPDSWIPPLRAVPGMSADVAMEQARIELVDPYMGLLLVAAVFGAALVVSARRRATTPGR